MFKPRFHGIAMPYKNLQTTFFFTLTREWIAFTTVCSTFQTNVFLHKCAFTSSLVSSKMTFFFFLIDDLFYDKGISD